MLDPVNNKYRSNFYIGSSRIHGRGIMANRNFKRGQIIGVVINYYFFNLFPYITKDFGALINHSYTPNSQLYYRDSVYYLVATKDINRAQEIIADYTNTPHFIQKPMPWYK